MLGPIGWALIHLVLLALDLAALAYIRKREGESVLLPAVGWLTALACISFGVAFYVVRDLFAMMAIFGQGLFVHGPVLLGLSAWLVQGRLRAGLAGLTIPIVIVGVDAYWLEPAWLERVEYDIVVPGTPRSLTIAVLSDIQTDRVTAHERRAVRMAMDAKPDILLLPGDLVHVHEHDAYGRVRDDLNALFHEEGVEAPLGVYAVSGNTDVNRPWQPVLAGLGGQAVWEATTHFEPAPDVHISALPFAEGFDTTQKLDEREGLHIAFAHGPDFALGQIEADLLIAGHIHGGQVSIPFYGPLITFSNVPQAWSSGHTEIAPGRHLLVSRGVGMERHNAPRLRFNCRPEVMIIRVRGE